MRIALAPPSSYMMSRALISPLIWAAVLPKWESETTPNLKFQVGLSQRMVGGVTMLGAFVDQRYRRASVCATS